MSAPIKVTQVRSTIGQKQEHRGTLRALGLGRIGQSAVHKDSPSLRGMLHRIGFLVKIEDAPQGPRKRVGRGTGSGTGKTSGRGQKGQKSRSGSHMMRAGFEGGQNPIAMALGKQRGPHKKTSMPFGPFRTVTTGVNLRDIARRFESGADVTPELMLSTKTVRTLRHPIKVLAVGELPGPMQIRAHGFSAAARQKIEAAGGTATVIAELEVAEAPAAPTRKAPATSEPEAAEPDTSVETEPEASEAAAEDEPEASDDEAEA